MKFDQAPFVPFVTVDGPDDKAQRAATPAQAAQTPTDRIAAARARALQLSKDSNSGEYGFHHRPSYYTSYAGPDSSEYEADLLITEALLIDVDLQFVGINLGGHFERPTGEFRFNSGPGVPIQTLRSAIAARIEALGVSEVLVLEYLATVHTIAEDRVFRSLSFDERMKRFRADSVAE